MTPDAIVLAVFRELQDTAGADFVVELVETFLEEAPAMLAELRSARTDADAERFRRAAHSLKSNGATFGAGRLAQLAKGLEMLGKDGKLDGVGGVVADLESAFSEVAKALKDLKG